MLNLYIPNSDLFILFINRLNNILENLSHCWNQSDYITHGYIKRERLYPIKHQIIFLANISTKKYLKYSSIKESGSVSGSL